MELPDKVFLGMGLVVDTETFIKFSRTMTIQIETWTRQRIRDLKKKEDEDSEV